MRFFHLFKKVVDRCMSLMYTYIINIFSSNVIIGKNSIVHYRSSITNLSELGGVKIGANCKIGASPKQYHAGMPFYTRLLCDGPNSSIIIGDNCRIIGASIHAETNVIIGDNCLIASGVSIMDSNGHLVYSLNRTIGRDTPHPISIGNNVWIGLNSVVLKGSIIGDNCVIAVGSVVKGTFPNNSLIKGNPAKVVKSLELDE